jgi:hypothetical protein
MATTTPSAALVRVAPVFTNTERLALAGFLAAYSGLTRQAYELDLRQFLTVNPYHCARARHRPTNGDAQMRAFCVRL